MPAYPNYYQPMAAYPQPQPYPQPMQDRVAQSLNNYQNAINQPQYSTNQPTIQQPIQIQYTQSPLMIGRFVNEFAEVTANDVPMDGKWAIFAKSDMSEIQARAWSPDGKIVPIVFKPDVKEAENLTQAETKMKVGLSDETTETLMKRFDDISEKLEKLEKFINKPTSSTSKAKREVDAE